MSQLYYTPPTDDHFEELKREALALWTDITEDSHPSYREEKIGRIENITNISDNFMYILAMFDQGNQRKIISKLSEDTKQAIRERMIDGGNSEIDLMVIGL